MQRAFIALNRQDHAHCLVRFVSPESVEGTSIVDMPAFINDLLSCKTHKQLVAAIGERGSLLPMESYSHHPYWAMPAEEFFNEAPEILRMTADSQLLAEELYMASVAELRANTTRVSRAAEFSLDYHMKALMADSGSRGSLVLIEPLQDWMLFRNMLFIGASLLANIENLPGDSRDLEKSGFMRWPAPEFDHPVYAAPLKYSASVWPEAEKMPLDYVEDGHPERDNLFWRYALDLLDLRETVYDAYRVGESADVFFSFSLGDSRGWTPNPDPYGPRIYWPDGFTDSPWARKDKRIFLCVKDTGGSQREMARQVVIALWNAMQSLTDNDGAPLGMKPNLDSLFDPRQNELSYTYESLMSKAWASLCFRNGRKLVTCKHCGCAVISSNRGRAKEYCSDSCRVQDRQQQ